MKTLRTTSVMTLSVIALILGLSGPITTFAATAPTLGAAASYAVFGKAGVTNDSNVGLTHIWGNVGADAVNVTNLNDATQVDGIIDAGAGVEADILIAYGQLAAIPDVPVLLNLAGNNTVAPGVYDVGATTLNGVLTLSGAGVYVFRSSSSVAVTPGVGAEVKLTNGADACNVFWQIPASMTIGAGAKIVGTIIADTALISLGTNATLQGRAFSRIAQVTMLGNQITEPTCTVTPPTPVVVTPTVVSNTGGMNSIPTPVVTANTGVITSTTAPTKIVPIIVYEPAPVVNPIVTPHLPKTGLPPEEESAPWNMVMLALILAFASILTLVINQKRA